MGISEIVKDSLRYPFSDWKKILVLGFIIMISSLSYIFIRYGHNLTNVLDFLVIGIIIGLLVEGYLFRIIKSSLNGMEKLPKFKRWNMMFKDGFKVIIINTIYSIPAILIVLIAMAVYIASNPVFINYIILFLLSSGPVDTALELIRISNHTTWHILLYLVPLYILIIYPIIKIAVATMADNDSKLKSAFKIKSIFNKIGNIGWINLLKWYITTFVIYFILFIIGEVILSLIFGSNMVGKLLLYLIIAPYLIIFVNRSTALIYTSK